MSEHARYLAWLSAVLAVLAVVPALNFAFLAGSGELTPLTEVVDRQQQAGAIYGTAVHDSRRELRLEILRHRQPEIVALGSSTSLDMRSEYFLRPFACACQAMDSIDD